MITHLSLFWVLLTLIFGHVPTAESISEELRAVRLDAAQRAAPFVGAELAAAVAGVLPLMEQSAVIERPDLVAAGYDAILEMNAGRAAMPTNAVDRAIADLAQHAIQGDLISRRAAIVLRFVGPDDRERAVQSLLDMVSTSMHGIAVRHALDTVSTLGGSVDQRVYQRFVLDPGASATPLIFPDRSSGSLGEGEGGVRSAAMLSRLRAGTLSVDLDLYPILNDVGRSAAVTAIASFLWSQPPVPSPLSDPETVQRCVEFLATQIGSPAARPAADAIEKAKVAPFALSAIAAWVSQSRCHPDALSLIEQHLEPLRAGILAQQDGANDPRLQLIDNVLQGVTTARASMPAE